MRSSLGRRETFSESRQENPAQVFVVKDGSCPQLHWSQKGGMTSSCGLRLLGIPSWQKGRGLNTGTGRHMLLETCQSSMASTTNTCSDKGLVESTVRKCYFVPETFQHN